MIQIHSFTFNPFQENTYVLYDETKECIIIDPGCYTNAEQIELCNFIQLNNLKPIKIINTHCHLDHIFGNNFLATQYNIGIAIHQKDLPLLKALVESANRYQLTAEVSPLPSSFLEEGDDVRFGNSILKILFTPGHSPGSISLYNTNQEFIISGDVLFYGSIGRTDFPGCDYATLIHSITNKLLPLGDNFKVYSGHGPITSIGFEKMNNPYL